MQIAHAYRIQKKKGHVHLRKEVSPLPAQYIYGDAFLLQQILNNILSNGMEFTQEGYVSLSVDYNDGNLEFCVSDSGKGIPSEKLDPFRQVELSDTREHGGTGLGKVLTSKFLTLLIFAQD